VRQRVLLPSPRLARRVDAVAREREVDVIFLDPVLPLGLVGSRLHAAPHVLIAHGAEVNVPGRLPGSRALARRVLRAASGLVAAGEYPARVAAGVAGAALPTLVVPPGVDPDRFRPLRRKRRGAIGSASRRTPLVLGLSRVVPRKGFDVLIDAVAGLDPRVQLAVGARPRRPAPRTPRRRAPDHRPLHVPRSGARSGSRRLYGCADVFAMVCRERWGGWRPRATDRVRRGGGVWRAIDVAVAAVVRTRRSWTARPGSSSIRTTPTACAADRVLGDGALAAARRRGANAPSTS
jgi:phosphatidylinositol alpha-1,6-mannosyltransferase